MSDYITYEAFGAKGDGRTDDMPAVIAAHAEANRRGLPVRAAEGAVYYIAPRAATAVICTDTDWTGARFVIDDRGLDVWTEPIFDVPPAGTEVTLPLESLCRGQTAVENPTGKTLYVHVFNDTHMDYIRWGANQNSGSPRTDNFLVNPDGTLPSPVSFDFDRVTSVTAFALPDRPLRIRGGEFTTIANQQESKYNYHRRNICIRRSRTELSDLTHLVEGELDHGAPYAAFLSVADSALVCVRDCLLTAHRTYWTIGAAGTPVPMGSYDLGCSGSADVSFRRIRQTTDILDRAYWGLTGTNHCRDLLFEDCRISRFDAHMGVTNCTLRRCRFGFAGINAIGFGHFRIEDCESSGRALVNLRSDYGSTFRGDFTIRNCVWHPWEGMNALFCASNRGIHDFGYTCYLPARVDIENLTVTDTDTLCVFNDWTGGEPCGPYPMVPPESVTLKNVRGPKNVALCENPALTAGTVFEGP